MSTKLALEYGNWYEIDSDLSLSIYHRSGGTVVYASNDSEPSEFGENVSIVASSSIGNVVAISGTSSSIWALAISRDAVIDYTEILDSVSTVVSFDGLPDSGIVTYPKTMAEVYTAIGRRFSHKFDFTFSGSESKYFLYKTPDTGSDFLLAIQERNFKSLNDSADLEVLSGATGYVATNEDSGIQKSNFAVSRDSEMTIYNLSDGVNTEPTDDGDIFDTDFVAGSGSGSNSSGDFSPQVGVRIYPAGSEPIIKVTNLDNSSNRISLEYSWIELPLDYLS